MSAEPVTRTRPDPKIGELLAAGPTYSIELFPPKTDQGRANLQGALEELTPFGLSFVSVTYGAGGSTQDRTQTIVDDAVGAGYTTMPHLTCIGSSRAHLRGLLTGYHHKGRRNVLALHGDAPKDNPELTDVGELKRAWELVELAREVADFSVGAAAHPEGHPAAPDRETDRKHQAAKLQLADFGVTQFFFRAEDYLAFIEDLSALGVETPIIPGIIPITDAKQVQKFAAMSGAEVPAELATRLDTVADDPDEVRRIGVDTATDLAKRLLDEGAPGLHLYALNRAQATSEVLRNLGLPREV
ncbi:5,10-methylenetetrahydrofolate reductase [Egibacter rhizosphaerae]|uniref:Methylenetetrahydrofolate reductase n=1 Tax=Egibacter rhizosphaerae TaxID=1670831 RepID=A0A411YJM2_9ACTN|nr:methylenetetrahydrofolate reductase [Egibacter rhizosphaerae]QBI21362.1 5,10-methylenetetrahydrofolate reductase [Egibacter rhizosphaerae]